VVAKEITPTADVYGSEEYKRKIANLLTEGIVNLAIKRSQEK
jgi:CO/xanthine dehydrogenase FAD-binding subunit